MLYLCRWLTVLLTAQMNCCCSNCFCCLARQISCRVCKCHCWWHHVLIIEINLFYCLLFFLLSACLMILFERSADDVNGYGDSGGTFGHWSGQDVKTEVWRTAVRIWKGNTPCSSWGQLFVEVIVVRLVYLSVPFTERHFSHRTNILCKLLSIEIARSSADQ